MSLLVSPRPEPLQDLDLVRMFSKLFAWYLIPLQQTDPPRTKRRPKNPLINILSLTATLPTPQHRSTFFSRCPVFLRGRPHQHSHTKHRVWLFRRLRVLLRRPPHPNTHTPHSSVPVSSSSAALSTHPHIQNTVWLFFRLAPRPSPPTPTQKTSIGRFPVFIRRPPHARTHELGSSFVVQYSSAALFVHQYVVKTIWTSLGPPLTIFQST